MQQKLDALYLDYLTKIMAMQEVEDAIENYEISSPFLLDVNAPRANYLNSSFKVAFVGQETNYWFNQDERLNSGLGLLSQNLTKYVDALKALYMKGNIGEFYRTSIFTFFDILSDKIKETHKGLGMINTNLIRHDYFGKGKLPEHFIEKVQYNQNEILRKEIEILRPDLVVFVTGPNYDRYIQRTYPNVTFEPIGNKTLREIAILKNIPNIKKAIRIYHPSYHNRKGANYKYEIAGIVKQNLFQENQ